MNHQDIAEQQPSCCRCSVAPPPAGIRVESINQLADEVFQNERLAPPELYTPNMVRAKEIERNYIVGDQAHPVKAGDFLVEYKDGAGNSVWAPVFRDYFIANFSLPDRQHFVNANLQGLVRNFSLDLEAAVDRFKAGLQ